MRKGLDRHADLRRWAVVHAVAFTLSNDGVVEVDVGPASGGDLRKLMGMSTSQTISALLFLGCETGPCPKTQASPDLD